MSKVPLYEIINNFKMSKDFSRQNIEYALKYEPKDSDKFIVTYPKCGTTWTQYMINLVINNGEADKDISIDNYFLELSGKNVITDSVIKTHLPLKLLPFNKKAKYLLVFRNPKDCCVSRYYHVKTITEYDFKGDFHEFFPIWFKGEVAYGDYFEHTLHYWNHRSDDNFQFLVYEQMKANPRDAVLKIAQFLGQDFVRKLENNEQLIEEIIKKSSIGSMKKDSNVGQQLVRKGVVGDWRQHFTREESDLVDLKVKTMFNGTGLDKLWESHMKWDIQ